jgi:hypothetical protein
MAAPSRPKPPTIIAQDAGSGTEGGATLNVPRRVGPNEVPPATL